MDMVKPSAILHQAGLKCTPKRAAVIKVLLSSDHPLTHKEIEDLIPDEINMNQVSLYRALEAFLEAGLIHRVLTQDRIGRFALCGCMEPGHCHPHFVCRSCGRIECLSRVHLPKLHDQLPGYMVEEGEMYLKGLCQKCNAGS